MNSYLHAGCGQTNLQAIRPKQPKHEPSTPPNSLDQSKSKPAACIPDAMLHALEQAWRLGSDISGF